MQHGGADDRDRRPARSGPPVGAGRADPAHAGSAASRGAKPCAAGIARRAFPRRQAQRAAPQARRREGLEPTGRDGEVGTGRSPKSPAVQGTGTPRRSCSLSLITSRQKQSNRGARSRNDWASMQCRESSTAPRRSGRGAGGRQAAWGLLRDQIKLCVPPSSSISRA